jgi:hypothetical protein
VNAVAGNWGSSRIIAINGSAASQMVDSNESNQQVRTFEQQPLSSVYPNPNSGNQVRIDLTDIGSGELSVKIMDGVGRIIYSKQFTVEGSLSTQLDFTEKLTAGIYLVEFTINGETMNERMVVER